MRNAIKYYLGGMLFTAAITACVMSNEIAKLCCGESAAATVETILGAVGYTLIFATFSGLLGVLLYMVHEEIG